MTLALGILAAYLLGSIPFALLAVKWLAGVDVRSIGSGNVGATNASRAFGKRGRLPVFVMIYLLDFGKGLLPTLYGVPLLAAVGFDGGGDVLYQVLLGAAAIIGHCTSPFLHWKGGKGVATTTGVFFVLEPVVLGIALGVFFLVLGSTRLVFLGSLAIGLTLAIGVVVANPETAFSERLPVTIACWCIGLFLMYTHRSNIQEYFAKRRTA